MISEIRAGHQAHVTMLQQMLGSSTVEMPTFQNLDATSLPQFLMMAQTLEDIDVNVHQGVLLNALQSGDLNPLSSSTTGTTTAGTTTGSTTAGTSTGGTTGATATSGTSGVYGLEVAILADDARYDGAIRAFARTIPTAEGGNATGTLTETGTPLGTGFTFDQANTALQSYIVGGIPSGITTPATTPGTTTAGTTTGGTTTAGTTTAGTTTAGTTTAGTTTAGTTTGGTTAGTATGTTAGTTTGTTGGTTAGTTTGATAGAAGGAYP
jgi:hypothetical protein